MAGSRLAVEAPDVAPALGGLLDVANVIDEADPHVQMGVSYAGLGLCTNATLLPEGCWLDYTVPGGGTEQNEKSFSGFDQIEGSTFGVYKGIECWLDGSDTYEATARRALEIGEGWAVEAAFQTTILNAASDLGTGLHPITALGTLEAWVRKFYGGQPVIHVSPFGATVLAALGLVEWDLSGLVTKALRTPVAVGSGYDSDLTSWDTFHIWVTPQVNLWRGPVIVSSAQDRSRNLGQAVAERVYSPTLACNLVGRVTVANPNPEP